MRGLLYSIIIAAGTIFLIVSCSGGDWMDGYWVNEDSTQYLLIDGDEIYTASRTSKKRNSPDINFIKMLFDGNSLPSFVMGKSTTWVPVWDNETEGLSDEWVQDEIKIKIISRESLYEAFPDLVEYDYSWKDAVDELLSENMRSIKLIGIEFHGEVDADLLFFNKKDKSILRLGKNNGSYSLSTFSKIELPKERKMTLDEQIADAWKNTFDDEGIAVYETGLVSHGDALYLFLHAYSHSGDKSEGKATMCSYGFNPISRGQQLLKSVKYDYTFKNATLYLTNGESYSTLNEKWYKLDVYEMRLSFDKDSKEIEGTLWVSNRSSFSIIAKPIDFDYSPWEGRNVF